jgi:hypothetical protein
LPGAGGGEAGLFKCACTAFGEIQISSPL